jgi:hypothetical protein
MRGGAICVRPSFDLKHLASSCFRSSSLIARM